MTYSVSHPGEAETQASNRQFMVPESLHWKQKGGPAAWTFPGNLQSSSFPHEVQDLQFDNQTPSPRRKPQLKPRLWSLQGTLGPKTQSSTVIMNPGPWSENSPPGMETPPQFWNTDPQNRHLNTKPESCLQKQYLHPKIEPCDLGTEL